MITDCTLKEFVLKYTDLEDIQVADNMTVAVYSAKDSTTGKYVIIKIFLTDAKGEDMYGYMHEVKIHGELNLLREKESLPNVARMLNVYKLNAAFKNSTEPGSEPSSTEKRLGKVIYDIQMATGGQTGPRFWFQPTCLIMEQVPGKLELIEYLKSAEFRSKTVEECDRILQSILFQIIYTLHVFAKNGLQHNDLHLANIMLDIDETRDDYVYVINGQMYVCSHRIKPMIIDWNLGSCAKVGHNPGLDGMEEAGLADVLNPRYDIYLFLRSVWIAFQQVGITLPKFNSLYYSAIPILADEPADGRLVNGGPELEFVWKPDEAIDHPYFDDMIVF